MITEAEFIEKNYWGLSTHVDAYNCDPKLIRSPLMIKLFVDTLCDDIKMKKFGDCHIVHFGEDEKVAGYSFNQLIMTSNINGHFAEKDNRASIDIFSCKYYDPEKVSSFVKSFFEASKIKKRIFIRE